MSLELKPVQVRLTPDAYEALRLLADIYDQDLGEAARQIITEALLGKCHTAKVTAERFARAVTKDNKR